MEKSSSHMFTDSEAAELPPLTVVLLCSCTEPCLIFRAMFFYHFLQLLKHNVKCFRCLDSVLDCSKCGFILLFIFYFNLFLFHLSICTSISMYRNIILSSLFRCFVLFPKNLFLLLFVSFLSFSFSL